MSDRRSTGSFWRQFAALCRKNWIILWHYRIVNILRCLILPIGYAAFFANAQNFFSFIGVGPSKLIEQLGPGYINPLQPLQSDLSGFKLVYTIPTNNATAAALSEDLLRRAMAGVSSNANIVRVANNNLLERECPTNFNGRSECYAGVLFQGIDPPNRQLREGSIKHASKRKDRAIFKAGWKELKKAVDLKIKVSEKNYTFRADVGLSNTDVWNPSKDDIQSRLLPLQWAIEASFIEMSTGVRPPVPLVWEYTNQSAEQLSEQNRINYLGGIRDLLVLAFFLNFLGVVYQLPGSMASERSNLLTSHLEAMGCRRSARFISWHLSISSAYVVAWIGTALIFQHFVFKGTALGLLIGAYLVTGLGLASWSQLVVVWFKDASTLAAIFTTFLAIVFNLIAIFQRISRSGLQLILTFLFPPMFFTFFTKALVGWERSNPRETMRLNRVGPEGDAPIAYLLIIAIVDIFLFPLIAAYLESKIYGVRPPDYVGFWRRLLGRKSHVATDDLPEGTAVQLENIHKVYKGGFLGLIGRKKNVTAIQDLSFSVPKGEIFCLLGRNGAAKSTTLHTIARLISATKGRIRYAPDQGLGIASQKDVLWDELTCMQHVALWREIKSSKAHKQAESDLELLQRSDLGPKIKFYSKNLSGGQKRKLQLACALAGGSNLLLLDEITSGLDPLSRRAIWKLISANRGSATIILTTHFLDEADYLGDHVAILQQPGRLLALDNPVALKTQIGRGFVLSVDVPENGPPVHLGDLGSGLTEREAKGKKMYFTGTTDHAPIRRLVAQLERQRAEGRDIRYQVNSATLEQVFLDLNTDKEDDASRTATLAVVPLEATESVSEDAEKSLPASGVPSEKDIEATTTYPPTHAPPALALSPGRKRQTLLAIPVDAFTIFLKRFMVFRRAWLLPVIGIIVTVAAACIPLGYMSDRVQTCQLELRNRRLQRLSYPYSFYPAAFSPVVISPSTLLSDFPATLPLVRRVNDNTTFVNLFADQMAQNISYGGISLPGNVATAPSLFAYEAGAFQQKGQSVLNFLSNQLLNSISAPDLTGLGIGQVGRLFRIDMSFRFMASPDFSSTAQAMKWIGFFGLGMAVWPAFAVIYPTQEKASNVRSNQYSNGASPVALWLGHLLWEMPTIVLISTLITILFATISSQFNAIGFVWFCLVLYGISSTLYSFICALFLTSPLATWALVAGTNVILFMLYLASYLLILTYDRSVNAATHISIAHYTISLICPVPSIVRVILVSINLFNLLCDGLGDYSSRPYGDIAEFGGPILYMVVQAIFAFGVLVYVDSGSPIPSFLYRARLKGVHDVDDSRTADVIEEKERLLSGAPDVLQVVGLKKRFGSSKTLAVNDVSFGVDTGTCYFLLGPNGAGKTTTLACIRGVVLPSAGDINVGGHSIVNSRNGARAQLGVCPQVHTIDQHLTVSQHLWVYGRLKGVSRRLLKQDIHALLAAAGLLPKADQLATSLSGGNMRKLGLAIALIGDRPVVLIDEFSSGVDPFSKREAWQTLAALTKDRAVVMTTHSMEEVDALANRVGIIASKMLAVGTPASLKNRFATYEIHLPAPHVLDVLDYLHERGFGEAVRTLDTLTRISVPGVREEQVGRLLAVLEGVKMDLGVDVTLHEASTETAFLSIVREHNVREEESRQASSTSWFTKLFRRRQQG